MLKERINYLCRQKNINRKELVHGLVATTHFANILAGRYPLPEDVAEKIAERLGVEKDYLLKTGYIDDNILNQAENITNKIFSYELNEELINSFPENNDFLTLELIQKLAKASFFLLAARKEEAAAVSENYLDFYLKQFENSETEIPVPLKKAILFYKMLASRTEQFSEDSLHYCMELQKFSYDNPNILLRLQTFQIEFLVQIRKFEAVEELIDKALAFCYYEGLLFQLTQLYIMYSGFYYKIGFINKALKYLEKAENSLQYNALEDQLGYSITIANNRIIMKIKLKFWDEMENDINTYERISKNVRDNIHFPAQVICYKCELYYQTGNLPALESLLKSLGELEKNFDQNMSLNFYLGIIEASKENEEKFMEYIKICLPYYEKYKVHDRLTDIYKILASQAEDKRQYKVSAEYYAKLVTILEESGVGYI
ncbi:helix-turn-helix transcriptional regulator [Sebaldella sp. S0638]|uniref:helix-turn-helix domain-containing protein n=1 Tax=Sebaldella sp. S0638 TaxID=2957809 RepID=UPI0020A09CDA|nr:helix-turn-helix transcriptional regulator [Sebaldella sp. S0638]MCP1226235.1 helix-turn-helix domain-containing protein [Sebaldella sp. S0638]